ncbi:hypothetical protein [Sphingomonas sp. 2378]|uniref:hypothetical protein n=1 Tax=Sphingomonas sp. 2378 TaxID=1219748 RepID=UPI00311AC229
MLPDPSRRSRHRRCRSCSAIFPIFPSSNGRFGEAQSGTGFGKAKPVGVHQHDRRNRILSLVRFWEWVAHNIAAWHLMHQTAGMSDPNALFIPIEDGADEAAMVEAALRCVEAFTDQFNARNLHGMDGLLHFPHVILSGENLVVWDGPGQLPSSFFDDLSASTGWDRTTYHDKRAVLTSPRKVHLVVEYTRDRADGTAVSHHSNLWIVTFDEGRWGIKQRSY